MRKLLEHRDKITFIVGDEEIHYRVHSSASSGCFLTNESGVNRVIFTILGLNAYDFCEKAYGYEPALGDCPITKPKDLKAVNRLINMLHDECNKYNSKL